MEKECTKCNLLKPFSEFYKASQIKDGYRPECKTCCNKQRKVYRKDNKEKISKYNHKYREENVSKYAQYQKDYFKKEENRERKRIRGREYWKDNKENILNKQREYYNKHREKYKEYREIYKPQRRKYDVNRYNEEPLYRLKCLMRSMLCNAFANKGYRKNKKTEEILGCDFNFLVEHIEKQFTEGMNWGNRKEWHIDHIIPLATAKTEEDIIRLNHCTNLQPLWAKDNLSKGDRLDWVKDQKG